MYEGRRAPTPTPPQVKAAASYRGWSGKSHGWRYYAQRQRGTGPAQEFLHNELRVQDVQITEQMSGPDQFTGLITPVDLTVRNPRTDQDEPLILPERGTFIHAEHNGDIKYSFLLIGTGMSGPNLSLDGSGVTTISKNIGYPRAITFIDADPLDVIRHMWEVIQQDQDSDIGMVVDDYTRTDALVGKSPPLVGQVASGTDVAPAVTSDDSKPYELNWWTTHDLGGEFDRLCEEHGIEYRVRSRWNDDKTQVLHFLQFGYPSIGIRRTIPRFVVGENIQTMPDLSRDGDEFANHVVVLGAGEGSAMIRGEARRRDGRVRTMVTLDDKSITDQARADRVARLELARRQQLTQITDIVVRNSGLAEFDAWGVGDEIRVQGMTDWSPFDLWVRVLNRTIRPDNPDLVAARIMRTDWF
jgi:hypothetical protein